MLKVLLPSLLPLLDASGYRVLTRTNGWAECLVHREGERWEGRGRTEDEAFADAIEKMLPSHLAKTLATHRVASLAAAQAPTVALAAGGGAAPSRVTAGSMSMSEVGAAAVAMLGGSASSVSESSPNRPARMEDSGERVRPTDLEEAIAAREAEHAAATTAREATQEPATPPSSEPSSAPPPVPSVPSVPSAVAAVASVASVAVAPPAASPSSPERSVPSAATSTATARARAVDVIASVEHLIAEIEEKLGRIARMSADQQRLNMMVWICRARAFEEGQPGSREVEQIVARVARRLTDIGKMFWPGSVRALQLSARPADVRRELHASWASEPANWREATVLAERLLQEHMSKCVDLGYDGDGWADAAACSPRPADADAMLEAVDTEIQAVLATVDPNASRAELAGSEIERLAVLARKLRWIRGGVHNDVAWGAAVGRLRRSMPALGDRATRVREALDHRTKPSVPWAKLLAPPAEAPPPPGEDPQVLRAELTTAQETTDGLVAWLIRALDVLNTPDLVALMVPIKDRLDALGEATKNHSDRRVRRRIRELIRRVATAAEAPAEPPPKSGEIPREEAPEENLANRALDELASRVREKTDGKRVLFVSNREDPDLGSRLQELLGVEITWCDGSLRRVQAQCERIKGGSYDLVLSATGFQVHGVDGAVSRAASSASVTYVRVNRGRPVACVQAIARELGLSSDSTRAASSE